VIIEFVSFKIIFNLNLTEKKNYRTESVRSKGGSRVELVLILERYQ